MATKYVIEEDDDYFLVHFLQRYLIGIDGIIAGGCFKNIFKKQKVKDIDIFFRSEDAFNKALDVYKDKINDGKFKIKYKNKNVVAFYDIEHDITVELIKKKFYGTEEKLLDEFDFTITKFAYYFEMDEDADGNLIFDYYVMYHEKFFEHLLTNKLVIEDQNLKFPFSTFERALRYTKYGYSLCRQSKINLIKNIRNQDSFNEDELSNSLYDGLD